MSASMPRAQSERVLVIWAVVLAGLVGYSWADASAAEGDAPRQIVVRLTREVFAPLVAKEVDRTTPIADEILGTWVTGQARTTGRPTVDLVEDPNSGAFVITLRGTTASQTVGRNGPAIIYSWAETQFTATKRITFEPGKGFVAEPARINARTRTTTDGIRATRRGFIGRLIVRRAWRRVAESQAEVDAIAFERAKGRIRAAFDQALETRLAQLNQTADLRPAIALLLGSEGEPSFTCCTRRDCIEIVASSSVDRTPLDLPALSEKAAPAQIWVHQSIVSDKMGDALKLLQQAGPGGGVAARALEVAGTLMKQFGLPEQASDAKPALNYITAEDWVVIQIEPGPAGLAKLLPTAGAPALASQPPKKQKSADRLWTSVDGRYTCVALLVRATPDSVTLKRTSDGHLITVPLWRLSPADRRVARN